MKSLPQKNFKLNTRYYSKTNDKPSLGTHIILSQEMIGSEYVRKIESKKGNLEYTETPIRIRNPKDLLNEPSTQKILESSTQKLSEFVSP